MLPPGVLAKLLRITGLTVVAASLGVLVSLFAPHWYRSTISVAPAKGKVGSGLAALLDTELGAQVAEALGVAAHSDLQRIDAILRSEDVSRAAIDRFGLRARYGAPSIEEAKATLWQYCSTRVLGNPRLVELSCEDRDPQTARELVAFLADGGNQVFRRLGSAGISERVSILEQRVEHLRQDANAREAERQRFAQQHQVFDLDAQAQAAVDAATILNWDRLGRELDLDYALTFSGDRNSNIEVLRRHIAAADRELRELGAAPEDAGNPRLPFSTPMRLPALREQYRILVRDGMVADTALVAALRQLELARADAAGETSTFQVLDAPALPDRAARPRIGRVTLAAALVGLLAALLLERHGLIPDPTQILRRRRVPGGTRR